MQTEFRIEEEKSCSELTEEFIWMNTTFAVGQLVVDIAAGKLRPKASRFPQEFIASFAQRILGVEKGVTKGPAYGPIRYVDTLETVTVPNIWYNHTRAMRVAY